MYATCIVASFYYRLLEGKFQISSRSDLSRDLGVERTFGESVLYPLGIFDKMCWTWNLEFRVSVTDLNSFEKIHLYIRGNCKNNCIYKIYIVTCDRWIFIILFIIIVYISFFLLDRKNWKKKFFSDFENDGNKKFSNCFKLCETYCRLRPVFITFFITIVIF